jgi:two-component system CheB/CheR fusion protein
LTEQVDQDFERLLEYVHVTRGFDYSGYKRAGLARRVEKRMHEVGVASYAGYADYLAETPAEFGELFNTILINVTAFFRDPEPWQVLRETVIPRLLAARPDTALRVWSAGCSTGEEPYTAAMLLGEQAYRERVKIYATDVDEHALTEARHASYSAKQIAEVPDDLRERFFHSTNGSFHFRNDIRRTVIFGRNDLLQDPPISRVDLLISRNTLMYFAPDAQQHILGNFSFALADDGFLMLGKAEALQSRTRLFDAYDLKRRIFVKSNETHALRPLRRRRSVAPRQEASTPDAALREASFDQAPTAEIVVDGNGDVVAVNMAARSMFGLSARDVGRPLHDLEVSYRPLDLRSLIERVREGRHAVTAREVKWAPPDSDPRVLDVHVAPIVTQQPALGGIAIAFVDVTRYQQLQSELERAQRELETAYEELQSTVEELETTNEELQSTNEELETTNEELQSTNEELETMNEELQSTNEELETMNDELRDRTDDALRASSFVGSILSSIPQSVIVVDHQLGITAWSRTATELWGLHEDEVRGTNFLNLDIGLPVGELRAAIRAVLAGEEQPPLVLDGYNRRGQQRSHAVSFAHLRSHGGDVQGAILLIEATRSED